MRMKFINLDFCLQVLNYKIKRDHMFNSWFEETRFPLQAIQNLEKAIVSEMLSLKDNPKEKSIAEHRINNFAEMVQQKSKEILTFLKEETVMKKQQMAIIEGQKSLKQSEKKKPSDVTWQNFYDKSRQIKQYYKKNQNSQKTQLAENSVQFFRRTVFMPPYKQPEFSLEENKGKYVDMHNVYLDYINLCKSIEEKEGLKVHDYLWFLQNMDKFDDFALNKKMKHNFKYLNYLKVLSSYLEGFIKRSRPLFQLTQFLQNIQKNFELKYQEGSIHGWQPEHDNLDESQWQFCNYCEKLFIRDRAYIDHLSGKNHLKQLKNKQSVDMNAQAAVDEMTKKQEQAKLQFKKSHENKKKELAFEEFKIVRLREELANVIYDTMNLVRKKQTRGYEEAEDIVDESSESQEADAPIYNPKNLPLGWDGKPIPYWLYKLHGLGIEYKCQICGNFSYWGRRAFQMHFQQWRHTYGMKCLKIPNTIHFKDVTTITDALALHEKLMRESQESQFRPDLEEEFEDNEGNILNKRTYTDMKKQGLIDN